MFHFIFKYNDVGYVEGYISETVQDPASGTIEGFRMRTR